MKIHKRYGHAWAVCAGCGYIAWDVETHLDEAHAELGDSVKMVPTHYNRACHSLARRVTTRKFVLSQGFKEGHVPQG